MTLYPSAPYVPFQFPPVVVSTFTNCAVPVLNVPPAPKNSPLMTPLTAPVDVTRNCTCPVRFHTTQTPPAKLLMLRVSRTLLFASRICRFSAREPPPSQSTQ